MGKELPSERSTVFPGQSPATVGFGEAAAGKQGEKARMQIPAIGLCLLMAAVEPSATPMPQANPPLATPSAEQELVKLSEEKWRWMSERKVDALAALFHEVAVFVHMGATMSRDQELEVIRSGTIQYKTVEIQETSVRFAGTTAIVLSKIRLVAVVGGNEVTNPFMVTEVYVQDGSWKLASLSFTRLLTPP
jgi:hypothetical protein